ncbi:hypothetical protein EKO27_g9026 [Xylaria grammica]|uniref:Protein kinase domain-containing protein n=1 Tax=Xylaria grammica TaxID=363999 RepID=A0A439CV79_9PEZI|nr:hypothetical protein EKO27_g9026 [Xylaria grammica]
MRDQWTGEAVDGRKYVRTRGMVDWMRKSQPNSAANGALLLDYVYEAAPTPSHEFYPVEWEQISNDNCIVMFGLLTVLGYGHLVDVFRRHDIRDSYLSNTGHIIKVRMLEGHFKSDESSQEFMSIFEHRRWEFSPVEFYLCMDTDLDTRRVLPFCRKQRINHKGATAELYEVAVEEDFVQESLRVATQGSKYDDRVLGPCYRFALKSYSEECQDIYKKEKNAFNGIANEQDMIKCLGTIQFTEDPQISYDSTISLQKGSYNILLEYGEDDLNEYFVVHNPPIIDREILDFWENLFQIADALQRIHNLEKKKNDGTPIRFEGCHADVKPDNILCVQGHFKLADFGFATFVPHDAESISPDGGTETYGAPEFFQMASRSSKDDTSCTVTNTIDTWSFACVISVAATWVVLGWQGIKQYQAVRKAAIKKVKSAHEAAAADLYDDTFHDGSVVLKDVTNWHKYLRQVMRKSDPISHRLLDLIDKEVLGPDPNSRLTSAMLYEKLKNLLLLVAKDGPGDEIPESIVESMISFDRTGPSTMEEYQQRLEASSRIQRKGDNSKRANKSARLTNIPPTKVAHRQVLETMNQNAFGSRGPYHGNASNYDSSAYPTSTASGAGRQDQDPESSNQLKISTIKGAADPPIYKEYLSLPPKTRLRVNPLRRPREDEFLSNFIKDRDIKFIVDNGTSMEQHFKNAKFALLVLAEKVAGSDYDGVDLIFTFANNKLGCQNVKEPRVKFDGLWGGSGHSNDVEEKIARFFRDSKRANSFEDRLFTIQFVSFGNDATDRLNALDDDMETKYGIPDVIDHEPWTGNPEKMILGSLTKQFDSTPTTPPAKQQDMLNMQPQSSPGLLRREISVILADAVGPTGQVVAVDPAPLDWGTPDLASAQAHTLASPLGSRINFGQAEPAGFLENNEETFGFVVFGYLVSEYSLSASTFAGIPPVFAAMTSILIEAVRTEIADNEKDHAALSPVSVKQTTNHKPPSPPIFFFSFVVTRQHDTGSRDNVGRGWIACFEDNEAEYNAYVTAQETQEAQEEAAAAAENYPAAAENYRNTLANGNPYEAGVGGGNVLTVPPNVYKPDDGGTLWDVVKPG